jgi:hypothetical protein
MKKAKKPRNDAWKAKFDKTETIKRPTHNTEMIWVFRDADTTGHFRFDVDREDFNAALMFSKLLEYSRRTWNDVLKETHDSQGKSRNHTLDFRKLSAEARRSIRDKGLNDTDADRLFSLSLLNKIRVIGLRENELFRVYWYDPNHEFCPSQI